MKYWLIILGCMALMLAGCASSPVTVGVKNPVPTAAATTSEHVRNLGQYAVTFQQHRDNALDAVKKISPDTSTATAIAELDSLDFHAMGQEVKDTQASVDADIKREQEKEKTIVKQDVRIKELEASDPVRWWLNLSAVFLIVGGVAVFMGSIFIDFLHNLTWLRGAAVGAVATGCIIYTIAYYLVDGRVLIIGCIGAVVVGGILWVIANRKLVAAKMTGGG